MPVALVLPVFAKDSSPTYSQLINAFLFTKTHDNIYWGGGGTLDSTVDKAQLEITMVKFWLSGGVVAQDKIFV